MIPLPALLAPLVAQSALILFDEFHFHRRRGLPRWERVGHPLDTATLIAGIAFTLWVPFSIAAAVVFAGLAIFSCAFVTKDEWVHAERCQGGEHWVHAMLFIAHPLVFLSVGWMWSQGIDPVFRNVPLALMLLFFLYQTVYWNFIDGKRSDQ